MTEPYLTILEKLPDSPLGTTIIKNDHGWEITIPSVISSESERATVGDKKYPRLLGEIADFSHLGIHDFAIDLSHNTRFVVMDSARKWNESERGAVRLVNFSHNSISGIGYHYLIRHIKDYFPGVVTVNLKENPLSCSDDSSYRGYGISTIIF